MWITLFLVLVFCTATLSSIPNPINVTFASENFRNILKWSPGYGTPADTKYNVRYAIYGDSLDRRAHWRLVHHCTEISRTWCDLSVETSDLEHGYFAKVRALSQKKHSKWVETPSRFDPKIETEFGPPHVSVEVDDKYALITMEGPMRYHPDNHTPQVSMATLYPHMTYNLSIHNTRTGMIRHFTWGRNLFKYHIVDKGTEYCFSAKTKLEDRHVPSKHYSSPWQCISTPEDPLIDQAEKMVIYTTVPVVFLLSSLAVGGYILHKYLSGKDQKSPYMLNPPTFHASLLPIPDDLNIFVISVVKEVPLNTCTKLLSLVSNPSPELQRPRAPPLVARRNSSVDYGVVSPTVEEVDMPDAGICLIGRYKQKEWPIEPGSSGRPYASQNFFLKSLSSSVYPALQNTLGENDRSLSLQENSETGTLLLQFNQNQSSNVNDEANVISSTGYATQNVCPVPPTNQSDALADDYGLACGLPPADDTEDMDSQDQDDEDADCLHLDWSPTSQILTIPGFDLGIGQRERGARPNLETVFVRQPSEEDALLDAERIGSDQSETGKFLAEWDLIVSDE
ncbi:hypothetical protein NL108_001814 [Boleophthalmus pectinirostris]|uniref:interleukin-20 receptor subunit alpha n=1 Tax=Boleophthalmus pectinirostris TaxID=150288 RepID=UPI00242B72FD|nr:interleukin-20 receptor subunit alpha [Boleophthalmus pectinirostris]XP_055005208.1 interleukin-20 receptor subunit alpha [Boleophthalmus pectinirostris]KAJ0060945.1 hypothetical protein NL108_001814 [Boleophthalmus pectinirostris]